MTQQTPQPEGQQPPPKSGSGFDAATFQQDLNSKTISVNNAWIITGLGGLLLIATFMPWATVKAFGVSYSASGADASGLYIFTPIVIAALGALVALRKIPFWGVAAAAGVGLLHFILTLLDIFDVSGAGVSAGIGIYLSLLGSLGVVGLSAYAYLKDKVDFASSGPLFPQQNNNNQPPAA